MQPDDHGLVGTELFDQFRNTSLDAVIASVDGVASDVRRCGNREFDRRDLEFVEGLASPVLEFVNRDGQTLEQLRDALEFGSSSDLRGW